MHSPRVDALLIGGASVLLWPFLFAATGAGVLDGVHPLLLQATILLVNYPHFMMSYKLAYGQGRGFVRRHWPQLVAVPAVLLLALTWGWLTRGQPAQGHAMVGAVDAMLAWTGSRVRVEDYALLGNVTIFLAAQFMYFTVGWHYARQTFGAIMVQGVYHGFKGDERFRRGIKLHLLALWLLAFVGPNTDAESNMDLGFRVVHLDLPREPALVLVLVVAATAAWVLIDVLRLARLHRRRPPLTCLVPLVAAWLWLLPAARFPAWLGLLPFFHSLQYLAFCFRVESRRPRSRAAIPWILPPLLVAAGYLAFVQLPWRLDLLLGSREGFGGMYLSAGLVILVNVHHYFIDNVLWRFHQDDVRNYLLAR